MQCNAYILAIIPSCVYASNLGIITTAFPDIENYWFGEGHQAKDNNEVFRLAVNIGPREANM